MSQKRPNVLVVLSDQHRAQAVGYAGNADVQTPNLDALARTSVSFQTAVSTVSVCSPARASLLTGQYATSHGLIVNDVPLEPSITSIADAMAREGYDTAYIGKWHVDGQSWGSYIPAERRHGFRFWRVSECTHEYNDSYYWDQYGTRKRWEGYDAFAQTQCAKEYLRERDASKPFLMFLAWGPPHDPYSTAPPSFQSLYEESSIDLLPNVPQEHTGRARRDLAGYYSHVSALDACMGDLLAALSEQRLLEDTIVVYTSDHGAMLGSQGLLTKQMPWDESILVPLIMRYPEMDTEHGRVIRAPFSTVDLMPTLLDMCGVGIPDSVEGRSYAPLLRNEAPAPRDCALIACIQPFGSWGKIHGGREYRGVRTERYTYVRDLRGPWLLYDNAADPYQLHNRVGDPALSGVEGYLEEQLSCMLAECGDQFLAGEDYIRQFGYRVDETGRVPIVH
ncbi:MAG: sulfatase [Anaerolineae bacterium]|jgi:arylsulfatase A-like enzyme